MPDAPSIEAIACGYHSAERQRWRVRLRRIAYPGFVTGGSYAVRRSWVELKTAPSARSHAGSHDTVTRDE
jgi:2-keto-4-pentenoate hydratase